jgi:predicted esterase
MKRSTLFSRLWEVCILVLVILSKADAQQTAQKFIRETDYLLYLPDGYDQDTTKKWPLVIFLHGSGERGEDIQKVKVNGPPKLVANGKKFPFILVSPQEKEDESGWETDHLYHLIQYVKRANRVDPDRVYLTGLSMGGFGTWALATKHPEEFAAIIPICGGGDSSKAWRLRYTPVWCFHGALDEVVPVSRDEQMVNAVKKYNSDARLTVYPDLHHNSWERTYNNDSIYSWLLSNKKFAYREIKPGLDQLHAYAGTFVGENGDTVRLTADSDGLLANGHGSPIRLKAAEKNVFYINDHMLIDLQFIRSERGKFDSFIVFEENREIYRRIH